MKTLLLILCLAAPPDFNMSGKSHALNMSGASVPSLSMVGEAKPAIQRRTLDFYGPTWCPNCPGVLATVTQALGDEFVIRVHKDYDSYPQWVLAQGQQKGWGYPMLHWTNNLGENKVALWSSVQEFRRQDGPKQSTALHSGSAAPTPSREVERVLSLLPKPEIGFVDYGCGDARWCIAAAERWGCKVTGVEIDPARAAVAKERVKLLGLDHLITIIEGDATTVDVKADVGVAYLYADVLEKLKPRIQKLRAFASYLHRPPGLPVSQNGDSWFYVQPVAQARAAIWGNQYYTQPVCNNPGCSMCNSIRQQLDSRF